MRRMMQKRRFERVSTEYGEITVKIAEGHRPRLPGIRTGGGALAREPCALFERLQCSDERV